jgi:trehalose 6-phosphate phosphatase
VARRIESIPLWHISGNHGLEPWGEKEIYATRVRAWTGPLRDRLAPYKGVVLEDKTYSLTVHYRHAHRKREAKKAISEAVQSLSGARVMGGHEAVNLIPQGAPDKGVALQRVRNLLVCDTIIYVGDDETDEDAFRAANPDRLLAVRVGVKRGSRARHWLRSQADVDAFLETLLSMRPLRHRQRPASRKGNR